LTFRFKHTPRFKSNFDSLEKDQQEIVKKELRKIKDMPEEHVCKRSPFLQGEFKGTRHYSMGRIRLCLRICRECRRLGHDELYKRCEGCERADDLINLIDVFIEKTNTYKNLKTFDKEDAKLFSVYN
jgi:mRNA-degrading endonuclease RelE of RelBE toxin-antitoxin system